MEVSAELPVNLKQTEGIINRELEQLEKLIVHKDIEVISDFHSVDDEEEGPESYVHSKQEYIDHVK